MLVRHTARSLKIPKSNMAADGHFEKEKNIAFWSKIKCFTSKLCIFLVRTRLWEVLLNMESNWSGKVKYKVIWYFNDLELTLNCKSQCINFNVTNFDVINSITIVLCTFYVILADLDNLHMLWTNVMCWLGNHWVIPSPRDRLTGLHLIPYGIIAKSTQLINMKSFSFL